MNTTQTAGNDELIGKVENIVFRKDDSSFTVLDVNCGGEMVCAVGSLPELTPGEKITAKGSWTDSEKYGRQFRVSSLTRSMPDSASDQLTYLSSGVIKGLGPKTALRIIEKFGDETFEVLEDHPDRLMALRGFSADKCKKLHEAFMAGFTSRKTMMQLENYGLTTAECTLAADTLGSGVADIVAANPYILCSAGCVTFTRAEQISVNIPQKTSVINRGRAGIIYVVRHNLWSNGHTCLPREKLIPPCAELLSISRDDTEILLDGMIDDRLLVRMDIAGREFISIPEIYDAEKSIADALSVILRYPPFELTTLDSDIDAIELRGGIAYESLQRQAIKTAVTKGLLILTGGPGTGKTTTVRGIIELYERVGFNIQLAAPTGRAAKRMTEVTGHEAKTIHRLLEAEYDKSDKIVFRRDKDNPIEADAVILDEMSMVDVCLFASFLKALPHGCRLIMVGDSDQLPPVGPGNVLSDMIKSKRIPVICLKEIFRQAQQSLIVTNAHSIIEGSKPILDDKTKDFFFLSNPNSYMNASSVVKLAAERLPAAYGISAFDDIQILCPSKKGDCGTVNLNIRLQEALNPPDQTKNELSTAGRVLREGDKVMQIKNNYNIEWEKDGLEGSGVYNGDIGILRSVDYAAGEMKIDFDGRLASYPSSFIDELELAYAITVHKSQGSEFDYVIIPIADVPPQLLYRNLLYTAVTRAKKLLIITGSSARLDEMIENNKRSKRYSALGEMLAPSGCSAN